LQNAASPELGKQKKSCVLQMLRETKFVLEFRFLKENKPKRGSSQPRGPRRSDSFDWGGAGALSGFATSFIIAARKPWRNSAAHVNIYRNDLMGALTFELDGNRVTARTGPQN
jgi:hypothetical protein